jgi:hypothetical protein
VRPRASLGRWGDEVLVEQVPSEIHRVLTRPLAIDVQTARGYVTLAGAVHDDEVESIPARVARLPA